MSSDDIDDLDPNQLITCWCGAQGTFEELFEISGLADRCGGTRYLDCECAGDGCVCHHHGGIPCDGCPDCESEDDYDWSDEEDGY